MPNYNLQTMTDICQVVNFMQTFSAVYYGLHCYDFHIINHHLKKKSIFKKSLELGSMYNKWQMTFADEEVLKTINIYSF